MTYKSNFHRNLFQEFKVKHNACDQRNNFNHEHYIRCKYIIKRNNANYHINTSRHRCIRNNNVGSNIGKHNLP